MSAFQLFIFNNQLMKKRKSRFSYIIQSASYPTELHEADSLLLR